LLLLQKSWKFIISWLSELLGVKLLFGCNVAMTRRAHCSPTITSLTVCGNMYLELTQLKCQGKGSHHNVLLRIQWAVLNQGGGGSRCYSFAFPKSVLANNPYTIAFCLSPRHFARVGRLLTFQFTRHGLQVRCTIPSAPMLLYTYREANSKRAHEYAQEIHLCQRTQVPENLI
jgi:hypothetical protein